MPLFESPLSVQKVKPNSQASITDLFDIHLILTDIKIERNNFTSQVILIPKPLMDKSQPVV